MSIAIIAEAGSNHNGDLMRACDLIDAAVEAGASSVKFQFILADGLYLPKFLDGDRYVTNAAYEQRRREEMTEADWETIWAHGRKNDIPISASVFCSRGVAMLKRLGAPYVKIASTDLTNHALIGEAAAAFPKVIVSTGMATLAEVDELVSFVQREYPATELRLMHCVSAYPCSLRDANTQRVSLLRECFGLPVGYSDHTPGEVSAAMALVQGARFFEKHFTIDRTLPGFDHAHALNPEDLGSYVLRLRAAASGLALPANRLSDEERVTKIRARRGVYAARDFPKGHVLSVDDLLFVRPSSDFVGTSVGALVGLPLLEDTAQFSALALNGSAEVTRSHWPAAHAYWLREMEGKGMHWEDQTERGSD